MKVLVTGHEGYIGSELVPLLLAAGHEVVGVDAGFFGEKWLMVNGERLMVNDDPTPIADHRSPTPALGAGASVLGSGEPESPKLRTLRKDVRDLVESDLAGMDAVIHLAALSNDPMGNLNPELTHAINHRASVRLAEMSREAGVGRFLFASSCSVYGLAEGDALVNEESAVHPLTAYAVSKVRTEEDVAKLADADFSPVFLRNSTAYGWSRRFRADLVLNNLAGWAYTTGEIRILSDGTPWRPLVHVQDIGRAFLALLAAPRAVSHNQVINIGSSQQNYRVRELAGFVQQALPASRVSYAEGGSPDPRSYRVDFARLNRLLPDFQPLWDAQSGARQLAQAYQQSGLNLDDFNGPRYVRLAQLRELIDAGQLDANLRWTS